MISHRLEPERDPLVVRRSGAGCADDLDAWLGAEATPSQADRTSGRADGDAAVDWDAPSRVMALVYDTDTQAFPSGVRAVLQKGSRRVLFEAEDYEVLVRITPHRLTDGYELIGQLLVEGLPLSGATVRIEADDLDATMLTDHSGGFRLLRLHGKTLRLSIAVDGSVLEVSPLVLGSTEEAYSVGPGNAAAS